MNRPLKKLVLVGAGITALLVLASAVVQGQSWSLATVLNLEEAYEAFTEDQQQKTQKALHEAQQLPEVEEEITSRAPNAPEFLNGFNLFKNVGNEVDLISLYGPQIMIQEPDSVATYIPHMLSFVERVSTNPRLDENFFPLLPLWPEYTMTTFGNMTAYLFPIQNDPLAYAKQKNYVKDEARAGEYMSRNELVHLLNQLFTLGQTDLAEIMGENNIVDYAARWKRDHKDGFRLIEAIDFIMVIREVVETLRIRESKAAFAQQLQPLETEKVQMNKASLEVLLKAFADEAKPGNRAQEVPKNVLYDMEESFGYLYGEDLTADMVKRIRAGYFERQTGNNKPIYQLPRVQVNGNCANDLFRKTYMGPVARTGSEGALITCGSMAMYLPANSYVLNLFSLPKISPLVEESLEDRVAFRSDAMKPLQNTLVIGENGEKAIKLIYRPQFVEQFDGLSFDYEINTYDFEVIRSGTNGYTELGAEIVIQPRNLGGDNLVLFDPISDGAL